MYSQVKCKNCRKIIFDDEQCKSLFLNSHKTLLDPSNEECNTPDNNILYVNEDTLPAWIIQRIEAAEWSRGRINCQYCDSRIGAFDFVSGAKCNCGSSVTPSVHIITSKVDLIKR